MARPKRVSRTVTRGDRTWMRGGEAFRYYGAGTKLASIDGLTETRAALANLPDSFRAVASVTIAEAAEIILTAALETVRTVTGQLRGSLGMTVRDDGLQAVVGSGAPHAPFVEFGTKRSRSFPFLMPAFRRGARHVRAAMKQWTGDAGEMARASARRGKNVRAIGKVAKRGQFYVGRARTERNRAERAPAR